jgi:hypothetical protein
LHIGQGTLGVLESRFNWNGSIDRHGGLQILEIVRGMLKFLKSGGFGKLQRRIGIIFLRGRGKGSYFVHHFEITKEQIEENLPGGKLI